MKDQSKFSQILASKMGEEILPFPTQEVHSVDEFLSLDIVRVLGRGAHQMRCRGLYAYGVA